MIDQKKILYLIERRKLLEQVLEDEVPDTLEDVLAIKKQIDKINTELEEIYEKKS